MVACQHNIIIMQVCKHADALPQAVLCGCEAELCDLAICPTGTTHNQNSYNVCVPEPTHGRIGKLVCLKRAIGFEGVFAVKKSCEVGLRSRK